MRGSGKCAWSGRKVATIVNLDIDHPYDELCTNFEIVQRFDPLQPTGAAVNSLTNIEPPRHRDTEKKRSLAVSETEKFELRIFCISPEFLSVSLCLGG
jgi:hypothetical protein